MRHAWVRRWVSLALVCSLAGCATAAVPYVGQGPYPQITRGRPIAPIDALGNVFGVLTKLLLWNRKADNHAISAQTEARLTEYLDAPRSAAAGTHFSLNEYAPGRAMSRLVHNHKVAWPYRVLLGFPITLVLDVLIPGRLFAGLIGGDVYNPFTDTVSIYSDLPSVALHEAGHAHDFNSRRWKGTYAALRLIPGVDLYQEYKATDEAIAYLIESRQEEEELAAYQVLYPAYGSYVGGYLFPPIGTLAGVLIGHSLGRTQAMTKARFYRREAVIRDTIAAQ